MFCGDSGKIPLIDPKSSSHLGNQNQGYNALDNKSSTIFNSKSESKDEYWTAKFKGDWSYHVTTVRIWRQKLSQQLFPEITNDGNSNEAKYNNPIHAKVEISGNYCGSISDEEASIKGDWIDVTCGTPVYG